jgi:hypothetical protein
MGSTQKLVAKQKLLRRSQFPLQNQLQSVIFYRQETSTLNVVKTDIYQVTVKHKLFADILNVVSSKIPISIEKMAHLILLL